MKALLQKNKEALKQKFGDKLWFHALRFCFRSIILLCLIAIQIICGILSLLSSGHSDDQIKKSSDNDRNADDIWKLTSGNDYYNKEPPDRFS